MYLVLPPAPHYNEAYNPKEPLQQQPTNTSTNTYQPWEQVQNTNTTVVSSSICSHLSKCICISLYSISMTGGGSATCNSCYCGTTETKQLCWPLHFYPLLLLLAFWDHSTDLCLAGLYMAQSYLVCGSLDTLYLHRWTQPMPVVMWWQQL